MTTEERHDSMLVKFITYDGDGNEHYVSSFYATNPSEILKILIICKENNIQLYINEWDEKVKEEYQGEPFFIKTMNFIVGSEDSTPVIEAALI